MRNKPKYWNLYRWIALPFWATVLALIWIDEALNYLEGGRNDD